jgi:glutaredoxin-related protein
MLVDVFIGMNNACLFYMHNHETYSSCGLSREVLQVMSL